MTSGTVFDSLCDSQCSRLNAENLCSAALEMEEIECIVIGVV